MVKMSIYLDYTVNPVYSKGGGGILHTMTRNAFSKFELN